MRHVKDQLARFVRRLDTRTWDRLALVVSIVLVLLLAHALAQLTWVTVPAPSQPLPPPSASRPATQARADYRQIANLHLFGQAPQAAARSSAPIDAPETRLNLTLRGILFNTNPAQTRAIISAPGQDDQIYQAGAQLPGGAVIDQIYADRVMLLRNGQYETLRLPEEGVGARTAPAGRGGTAAPGPAAAADLAAVRRDIMNNPQNVANYIQAEPVNRGGGGLLGFRVRPGQNPTAFQLSGLQEGDIVTAINGVQLDNMNKAADALSQLASSDVVNVSVLRNGAEFTLQLQLQNPAQ